MGVTTYSKETALYDKGKVHDSIADAGKTANNYVTDITNAGIFVHHNDGGSHTAPTAANARGVKISDTVDIIRGGKVMAEFGGGSGDEITLGENVANGLLLTTDSNSMEFYRIRENAVGENWRDSMFTYKTVVSSDVVSTYIERVPLRLADNVVEALTSHPPTQVEFAMILSESASILLQDGDYSIDGGIFTIDEDDYYSLTGHYAPTDDETLYTKYKTTETIYYPQMWLGNAIPEDDIRFQVSKDDNSPGFTIDKNGCISAANILSGISDVMTVPSEGTKTITINFDKAFSNIPVVVCTLTKVTNDMDGAGVTNVHQLVAQVMSVTTTTATFGIRNNGTLNRRAKISWMAFAN